MTVLCFEIRFNIITRRLARTYSDNNTIYIYTVVIEVLLLRYLFYGNKRIPGGKGLEWVYGIRVHRVKRDPAAAAGPGPGFGSRSLPLLLAKHLLYFVY